MKFTFISEIDGELTSMVSAHGETMPQVFELFMNFLRANQFYPDDYDFADEDSDDEDSNDSELKE
jgi:hypothetical protein